MLDGLLEGESIVTNGAFVLKSELLWGTDVTRCCPPFFAFALRQRVLVVVMACILTAGGIYAFRTIAIDAFPDVTTVLVQVVTKVPGMSPAEVERFVTFPMELQLMGAPGLTDIRSFSKVGLSMITVVFKDDIDIYLARQVVLERILEIQELLPPGSCAIQLFPEHHRLKPGQFYPEDLQAYDNDKDFVMSDSDLMERRTIEDWVIRPLLKGLPDVVDVNSLGGFVKQYQVMVEPGLLRKYGLSLHDVFDAVAKNNANAGGNILEKDDEKYVIRGVGLIKTLEDIDHIVVKQVGGTPVYVRDVAEVRIGHAVRHGAAVLNGKHEVITGIVLMLRGGNARDVVQSIKDKISEIHHKRLLPDGLRIIPFYDRIELITAALDTVYKALLEGIVLVVVILFLFLGNVRSALIVTATLIVTPLVTFIIMDQVGLTANLMSLGGLVIAIGMMVDGSVVVVENVYRHLAEQRDDRLSKTEVILHAVTEVGQPVIFGILIIILVFLPILTLQGMEGKMFQPLANTIIIALLVSLVLSLTLSLFSARWHRSEERKRTRSSLHNKWAYLPTLRWAMGHRSPCCPSHSASWAPACPSFPFSEENLFPS